MTININGIESTTEDFWVEYNGRKQVLNGEGYFHFYTAFSGSSLFIVGVQERRLFGKKDCSVAVVDGSNSKNQREKDD